MRRCIAAVFALIGAFLISSGPAAAVEDPAYLWVGAGTWETLRSNFLKPEIDVAYRSNYKLWIFKPHAGVLVAGDGDYYGYVGLLTDIYWSPHIVTTITAAFGGYGGGGYKLGSHFEFRTGGDVAWRFDNRSRIGVGLYHISNAGITQNNGGSESVLLSYSLPIDKIINW